MKYTTEDMSMSWAVGNIMSNTLLVKRGVRPIANESIQNYCVDECVGIIKKEGLCYMLDRHGETHTVVYIFKYPYLENIINFRLGKPYDKKILGVWVDWKMSGASEEEVDKRIKRIAWLARLERKGGLSAKLDEEMKLDMEIGERWAIRYEKKRKQEKSSITR